MRINHEWNAKVNNIKRWLPLLVVITAQWVTERLSRGINPNNHHMLSPYSSSPPYKLGSKNSRSHSEEESGTWYMGKLNPKRQPPCEGKIKEWKGRWIARERGVNVLSVTRWAIITGLHPFRVNVDRLPAARDKALKIIGRRLRANVKLLSHREWVRWSYRVNCTVRHYILRRHGSRGYLICWVQKWVGRLRASRHDLCWWPPERWSHSLIRGRSKHCLNLWDMLGDKLCDTGIKHAFFRAMRLTNALANWTGSKAWVACCCWLLALLPIGFEPADAWGPLAATPALTGLAGAASAAQFLPQ